MSYGISTGFFRDSGESPGNLGPSALRALALLDADAPRTLLRNRHEFQRRAVDCADDEQGADRRETVPREAWIKWPFDFQQPSEQPVPDNPR